MKLQDIHWPVFKLKNRVKPLEKGTVTYYEKENISLKSKVVTKTVKIIDDKGMGEDLSLGVRRLKLKIAGIKLFPLTTCYYFLRDVLRSNPGCWYIDSKGYVFQYKKTRTRKLLCRKITKVIPMKDGIGSIIEVEGTACRFSVLFKPDKSMQYAGILKMTNKSDYLYSLYSKPFKDTSRIA